MSTDVARILLVEDDAEILFITARLLEKEGHEVTRATCGADALAEAARTSPTLALVDRVLPDMDGMEICRRIKQNPSLSSTLVVMTSGLKTHIDDQVDGLNAGADGYITRPIGNRELLARVNSFLRLARPGASLRKRAEVIARTRQVREGQQAELDLDELMHELDIYQVELELQNRELRLSQRRLERVRDLYFRLYHNAPVGYLALDDLGFIRMANLTIADMLGVELGRLNGASFVHLLTPGDQKAFLGRFRAFHRSARNKSMVVCMLRDNGTELHVRLNGTRLPGLRPDADLEGDEDLLHVTLTDVTPQVEAQRRLRRSQESLVEAQRIARMGALVYESASDQLSLSQGLVELLELQGEAPRSMEELIATLVHPEDRAGVGEWLRGSLKRGAGEVPAHEFRVELPSGPSLFLRTVGRLRSHAEGLRLLLTLQDITERTQLQAQLLQADRLRSMGILAAGVAHEINNPLTYVLGHLEEVHHPVGPDGESVANEGSRAALEGVRRIRDLVLDLKTFARVEVTVPGPVDVGECIQAAARMARNQIKHRATLTLDTEPLPPVLGTEGRLGQVFLNLLINAAHAVDQPDHVEGEMHQIVVRARRDGAHVCVEVTDDGPGIAPLDLERIFEPFYSTKNATSGSGLGLAITRGIVEDLGGTITVQSVLGHGATFRVRLPACESRLERQRPTPRTRARTASPGRVLLIDDEAPVRRVLATLLRAHEVVQAGSVAEARELVQTEARFDVVLCDLMMPGADGTDLHTWLREHHPDLASRLIFISGGAFLPRVTAYLDAWQIPCIAKPPDRAELRRLVAERVEASDQKSEGART